jgi:xanthine dehydrogenase small subunit
MRETASGLSIGAGVSLTAAWAALTCEHPGLAELAQRFASPPICNAGTLCGNIANGSPIGDAMPALLALDATLELRSAARTRQLPLSSFYLGYRRTALEPGELITAVNVPRTEPGAHLACYKLAKRQDQDISGVCAAFSVRLEHGRVAAARLAFGAMAAVPARARHAEDALIGQIWGPAAIAAAATALGMDFAPLTDMRASAAYRLQAAGNLLQRYYLEHPATQHGEAAQPARLADALAAITVRP